VGVRDEPELEPAVTQLLQRAQVLGRDRPLGDEGLEQLLLRDPEIAERVAVVERDRAQ
jgi:hypothetical protein